MGAVLERLAGAVDELVAADPRGVADRASIAVLHRELERLEAATTRAVAVFDTEGEWALEGARTAAAWLTHRLRVPAASAKRRVALGRALREMPVSEAAWAAGELTGSHVGLLARARNDATAGVFARDERSLVEEAGRLTHAQFGRVVDYWVQHADPDGVEVDADARRDRRRVHLSSGYGGVGVLDGFLDPVSAAVVGGELARLERKLFERDWASAKEALGRDPAAHELARTSAQRRHDALVEMATRSASCPPGARRPAPLFTVLVGWETLHGRICELANGTVVTPGDLVPWLTQADLERAVFDPKSRAIDVGVTSRLFQGATRRGVEIRDGECFHNLCNERDNLQVDHIIPYASGGPTTQDNGRLACAPHNRNRNKKPRGP